MAPWINGVTAPPKGPFFYAFSPPGFPFSLRQVAHCYERKSLSGHRCEILNNILEGIQTAETPLFFKLMHESYKAPKRDNDELNGQVPPMPQV
jgi:hypothetical protein